MKFQKDSSTTIFSGDVVSSDRSNGKFVKVEVSHLLDNLYKVSFEWNDSIISFRCFQESKGDDELFQVQQSVKEDHLIQGVGGFLYNNPKIHGGYIKRLNGFYFHIMINHFSGASEEIYFFGKKRNSQQEKAILKQA